MDTPGTLVEAVVYFSDPVRCRRFVERLRWPDGVECPECGTGKPMFLKTRGIWKCRACYRQFSVKKGTIFEDSALGLDKWLVALWLIANAKNGISSCEIARSVGVTQKTAWHMAHRIRLAMQSKTFRRLSGQVEVDETFVGGSHDPRRKSHPEDPRQWYQTKQPVFGALERSSGAVTAYPIPDVKADTLCENVAARVWPGSELFTDNAQQYVRLRHDYAHTRVSHSTGEWAIGDAHTNGIENFWCLLKRSVRGTWIRPSPKHIGYFVSDQVFRFNQRTDDDYGRFSRLVSQVAGIRLTWNDLVGR